MILLFLSLSQTYTRAQFLPASAEEKLLRPFLPNVTYDEEADKGNWISRLISPPQLRSPLGAVKGLVLVATRPLEDECVFL